MAELKVSDRKPLQRWSCLHEPLRWWSWLINLPPPGAMLRRAMHFAQHFTLRQAQTLTAPKDQSGAWPRAPGATIFPNRQRPRTPQNLRMKPLRFLENLQSRPVLRELSTVGKPSPELRGGSAPACPLLITLALWQKERIPKQKELPYHLVKIGCCD
jgi:hypothetical protein